MMLELEQGYDEDFARLSEMGFSAAAIRAALTAGGGLDGALPRLLEGIGTEPEPAVPERTGTGTEVAAAATAGYAARPDAETACSAAAVELDSSLPQVSWLVAEGFKCEQRAAKADTVGSTPETVQSVIFYHRRASQKLSEAAALCPADHRDKPVLERYAQEINVRLVYLEGLGPSSSPSIALEDHVSEMPTLSLDLQAAALAPEKMVSALVSATVSGESAALSEEGFQLVIALKNDSEMRQYLMRVLKADFRKIRADCPDSEVDAFAARCSKRDHDRLCFVEMRHELRSAPWVQIDHSKEKLELGVALSNQAHEYAIKGQVDRATLAYRQAIATFQLVQNPKFDSRANNPNVMSLVDKMIATLKAKVESLR